MTTRFTSELSRALLVRACRTVGEDPCDAELLRFGSNAIFRLAGRSRSLVVRVARSLGQLPTVRLELCISRWLNGTGRVPATRVYEDVAGQPRVVDGHPVTFWHAVDQPPEPPTAVDLAHLLRGFHLLNSSPCRLPRFDPFAEVRARLYKGLAIPATDREFIVSRCSALEEALPDLPFVLPVGPIHGDAHTGNLLGGAGAAILNDFEMCALGPREWDLVPLAVAHTRLGLPAVRWRQFADAYGFDVRAWPGYPVLREARELGMTTWLAQNLDESPAIARELAVRLESLRSGDQDRAWTAF